MSLEWLVDKLSSYLSWLYYRRWEIWELKIAVITIAVILLVLLLGLITRRRQKTRARIAEANQGQEGSSLIVIKLGKRMKKIAILALIIIGLIDLSIFCYRLPKPTEGFYLRSQQTGKLIGPVSLPKGYIQPPLDKQTYVVTDPTESELEVRNHLLQNHVTVAMTGVPLTELIDLVVIPYLGNNPPTVRFEIEDKLKLPRVNIDARDVSLYEVLFVCAYQANLQVILKEGAIVLYQKPNGSEEKVE